ncbi:MAG: Stage II sporulation protein E [Candidatus Dichloromethanomonas elyunquensis]|nr:MAG: Stage II sporulation protein E [Candidatus Dichloromethanomonas elyunquensis]
MAEWATFKTDKILNKILGPLGTYLFIIVFACMISRANILGIYPFAVAYIAVLAMNKNKLMIPGITGIILGIVSIQNYVLLAEVLPSSLICAFVMPKLKDRKGEFILLPLLTAIFTMLPGFLVAWFSHHLAGENVIMQIARGILAAGFSVIFLYGFLNKDSLLKGNFSGEQGMVWILILSVSLSGLQGLTVGTINFQLVVLSFFILYVADRFGAGSGAGTGAILGFLLQWKFGIGNLVDAGIYGLIGFVCGGFRRFGKAGLALSFMAAVLMMTFFVNERFLPAHIYSSGLGLFLFILLPGKKKEKMNFKKRVMPEIETTVSKVKTLAEIFDQLAYGFQAAGLESKLKPEVPELMNVLVERICKNCATVNYCWEREFYRTYNFMFDLFALQEENGLEGLDDEKIPPEWKKYCGRLHELILGARFILEQQKDREVWQKRLALNRDALAEQYRSVSQVIGHLAQELHSRHNIEEGKPLVWSRHHRLLLDLGAGTFIKTGNAISGDNFSTVPLSPHKSAMIVCDGMGVGEEAARMSSAALTILEQLLSTGFEPEGAVKALNAILVLRSPEESFVTVDMVIIDLEAENARLIKIGAAPTYVIGKDRVEMVKTSSLPAGILNDIEIPVIDIPFKDQTLVIVTDGVLDAVSKEDDWLKNYLERNKGLSSQELADKIVREAAKLSGDVLEDDGVVLIVARKDHAQKTNIKDVKGL